jgi:hypothetical protein
MIAKPTVLVLGAGASVPYNFPTGEDLARWTASKCNQVNGAGGVFRDSDFSRDVLVGYPTRIDPELLRQFGRAFMDSGCSSLDAFVEAEGSRRFLPLVKAAMIHRLLQCELDDGLFPDADGRQGTDRRDWCAYLFREFLKTQRAVDFSSNQLKVITFNFDRSFERKLFRLIKAAYGISDAEAGRLRMTIPVLHMHGSLGGERWCGENCQDFRDYSPLATPEQKAAIFDQIRIVHEEIKQQVLGPSSRMALVSAQNLLSRIRAGLPVPAGSTRRRPGLGGAHRPGPHL